MFEVKPTKTAARPRPIWIVDTLAEVADFFEVSTKTIQNWKRDGMPGPDEFGRYDISYIALWDRYRSLEKQLYKLTGQRPL